MSVPSFLKSQLFVTPPKPTADFSGKTIIVTGANTGLGLDCAKHLVNLHANRIILACRSLDKAEKAKQSIHELFPSEKTIVEVWQLDLANYQSILHFVDRCQSLERLDAVVENAGVSTQNFSKAEGDEITITVNVISATLLTILLLPKLQESAKRTGVTPYVTIVSSVVHAFANTKELTSAPEGKLFEYLSEEKKAIMTTNRYNLSKLLILFAMRELSARVESSVRKGEPRVIINNAAPGWAQTELFREDYESWPLPQKWLFKKIGRESEVASRCLVHGIYAGVESQGQYLSDCTVKPTSSFVRSKQGREMQSRVWNELVVKLVKISPNVKLVLNSL